jgi:hypothetical protein
MVRPLNFYDEPIQVEYRQAPAFEKSPPCPDAFVWREERFVVVELLEEWHDFNRRGRMRQNMTPAHTRQASLRGSWGVGRFHFRGQGGGGAQLLPAAHIALQGLPRQAHRRRLLFPPFAHPGRPGGVYPVQQFPAGIPACGDALGHQIPDAKRTLVGVDDRLHRQTVKAAQGNENGTEAAFPRLFHQGFR